MDLVPPFMHRELRPAMRKGIAKERRGGRREGMRLMERAQEKC
jgi:hypothetical protein